MDEEYAVFTLGRQLSSLRNSGENLSVEKILVGQSWVLPDELADEYDKYFPPGPRRHKQVTSRVLEYDKAPCYSWRGEMTGLLITFEGMPISVLQNTPMMYSHDERPAKALVKTSLCNRFDVVTGLHFTFIIDKLEWAMSITRGRFEVDNTTHCFESPIATSQISIQCDIHTHYPFIPFAEFWPTWAKYVDVRRKQINEIRNSAFADQAGVHLTGADDQSQLLD